MSREQNIKAILETHFAGFKDELIDSAVESIMRLEPTADVVEVVRCKDCIFNREHETQFGSKFHICDINNLAFTQYADFYCAYGERKGEKNVRKSD